MEIITREAAREQGLKTYFTGKECKHGHVRERRTDNNGCVECIAVRDKAYKAENKEAIAAYKAENKEAIAEYKKAYQAENKEAIAEQKKVYREENKEAIAEYQKSYQAENKEAIAEYKKAYNTENPLAQFARGTLQRIEGGLEDSERTVHYGTELGYTQAEFIENIEKQFQEGMTWERRSEFHIDHIKPISLFLKEGVTDIKIINALSNLQPLWAKDNLIKGSTY